jgi:hypothetical protein
VATTAALVLVTNKAQQCGWAAHAVGGWTLGDATIISASGSVSGDKTGDKRHVCVAQLCLSRSFIPLLRRYNVAVLQHQGFARRYGRLP